MSLTTRRLVAILALCVCFGYFVQGHSNVWPSEKNPAFPGMCFDSKLNQSIAVGGSIPGPNCTRIKCFDFKPVLTLIRVECTYAEELPASCKVIAGDPTKNHPGCCSRIECDLPLTSTLKVVG